MPLKYITPLLFLFIYSCAGIVTPTGGPKDEKPPVVTKKVPADNTTRFSSGSISFYFDEYITVNDIANQFIISPPLEKAPDISVKGKKVEVKFNEELKPNTTYTLNFGNSIADNNEGNKLQELSYTFSTGDYIDSLTLQGKVIDAFTQLPGQNIAVGLYETQNDSTIFKTKPSYLVRPDSSGKFKFNFLRPAEYELVAFEDANRNLKIESSERIAFNGKKIILSYEKPDSGIYNLLLSPQPNPKKPQLITAKEKGKGRYEIITTGSNCKLEIQENGSNKRENFIIQKQGENCDTLIVYSNIDCRDSTVFNLTIDSITEKVVIKCFAKDYAKMVTSSPTSLQNYNYLQPLKITFTNPVFEIRETEIKLLEDSIPVPGYTFTKDSIDPLSIYLNYNLKEGKSYTIIFPKQSIKDIYNQANDSFAINLKTAAASTFGNLTINIVDKDSSQLIVQLLDNQSKVLQQKVINSSQSIAYTNLIPAHYFIKVIKDENRNGKWDGADYFTKKQPEPVFITPQSIEIRANWDLSDTVIDPSF